jgi:DNA-binding response OmpR family regulator
MYSIAVAGKLPVSWGNVADCFGEGIIVANVADCFGEGIIVADDDYGARELLVGLLDEEGFTTTAFARGEPALAAVNQNHFDLLLVDQWLPDLDGIQICETAYARYGDTAAILMVTADPRTERHITALTVGADDVVTKPFDIDVLLARIEAKLRGKRMME